MSRTHKGQIATFTLRLGCLGHMYNFTALPDRNCWACNKCGALFGNDELRAHLVHLGGCAHIHIYCCAKPTLSILDVMVNAKMLFCSYGPAPKFDMDILESARLPQPDEPSAEREPAVCRWCRGKREITINFKTKPCDCVKKEVGPGFQALREACDRVKEKAVRDGSAMAHLVNSENIGVGWKVRHEYHGLM